MTAPTEPNERDDFSRDELAYLRRHREDLDAWLVAGRFQLWIVRVAVVLGLVAYGLGHSRR